MSNSIKQNGVPKIFPQRGAALLITVLLFALGASLVTVSIARATYYDVITTRTQQNSLQSYYTAESGVEDAIYRNMQNMSISASVVLTIGSTTATTTITPVLDQKNIDSVAQTGSAVRKLSTVITVGNGASFNFGMQSDNGGITMQNSSSVTGNVYANGSVTGGGSSVVGGDIISGGATGLINGVHATGSAWAHSITASTIDKNAYYQSILGSTVGGNSFPGSIDQATSTLPISDDLIAQWEAQAASGTVITSPCPYTINASVTLGATLIDCNDVTITGNATNVTLTGPLWIKGNLTLSKANFYVGSSIGTKSVQIVVDEPASHATGSIITVSNSANFYDADGGNSYVLLLSRNSSARNSGAITAINLSQSASGKVLVYAGDGRIDLANSVSMKEVTGYRIVLGNNTNVAYETGLANLLFTGGPGGAYIITRWNESQ